MSDEGDAAPPVIAPRPGLFVEVAVVLLVAWVPLVAAAVYWRFHPIPRTLGLELYQMVSELGLIALLCFLVRRGGESLETIGLRASPWWAVVGLTIATYCAVWLAVIMLDRLCDAAGWQAVEEPGRYDAPRGLHAIVLPLPLLVGAFLEELLYRGYLAERLERLTRRPVAAVVISSILFASAHPYSVRGLLSVFVMGLVFGALYRASRNVISVTLAHFAMNLTILYAAE